MKIDRIVPLLNVVDVANSIAFYRDALAFALENKFESEGSPRCAIQTAKSLCWCSGVPGEAVELVEDQHKTGLLSSRCDARHRRRVGALPPGLRGKVGSRRPCSRTRTAG